MRMFRKIKASFFEWRRNAGISGLILLGAGILGCSPVVHMGDVNRAGTPDEAYAAYLAWWAEGSAVCEIDKGARALQEGRLAEAEIFFAAYTGEQEHYSYCAPLSKTLLAESLRRQGKSGALALFDSLDPKLDQEMQGMKKLYPELERSKSIDLFLAWFYHTYGQTLEKESQLSDALTKYRRAVELGGKNVAADIARIEERIAVAERERREARRGVFKKRMEQVAAIANSGGPREALPRYSDLLGEFGGQVEEEGEILEAMIALSQTIQPPPAVPEEARRHVARGLAAIRAAAGPADYALAREEFNRALRLAPWVADIHYNLGIVEEQAGAPEAAIRSFGRYLLAAPDARDRAAIQTRIYDLEFAVDLREIKLQEWTGTWRIVGSARENRDYTSQSYSNIGTYDVEGISITVQSGPAADDPRVFVRHPEYRAEIADHPWKARIGPDRIEAAAEEKTVWIKEECGAGEAITSGKVVLYREGGRFYAELERKAGSADFCGVSFESLKTETTYRGEIEKISAE